MDFNTPFDFQDSGWSREARDVRFMYFTPEEVRRISVEELQDVPAFDEWGEPLDSGLHAPSMGPMAHGGRGGLGPRPCTTCGLEKDCPGHMGRIELAVVLFNPFLMQPLHRLLQKCCLKCARLRVEPTKSAELVRRLKLLLPGAFSARDTPQAPPPGKKRALQSDVDRERDEENTSKRLVVEALPDPRNEDQTVRFWAEPLSNKSLMENTRDAEKLAEQIEAALEEANRAAEEHFKGRPLAEIQADASSCLESAREEIERFYKEVPPSCPMCKEKAPKWRKEGWSQLFVKRAGRKDETFVKPGDVRAALRQIWQADKAVLGCLLPGAREQGADIFFLENLLVPPNRFRPPQAADSGAAVLSKQSSHLANILRENANVRDMLLAMKPTATQGEGEQAEELVGDVEQAIQHLQLAVNGFMDSGKSEQPARLALPGIRQQFEKKEGIFRMKMMGKRVNFAARSVISPDLNIEASEIGIPQNIAEGLQYPEVATTHNADTLGKLVERGPFEYPGAVEVHVPKPNGGKVVFQLHSMKEEARRALAKQLITDIESGKPPMTVFRQLRHGDPLLVNRQPTLHKPGIMAHTARVLRQEKTIRLHYVNCNTYNADFDGDEMNLHAPQDPISRMEALHIAKADRQYLVPTSGKPLRGLIQDHVIAGTMLCKRDTYFSRSDVCLFLYTGLRAAFESVDVPLEDSIGRPFVPHVDGAKKRRGPRRIRGHPQRFHFSIDPPCIQKPRQLWSGKQVFSMLLKHVLAAHGRRVSGGRGLALDGKAKTQGDLWNGKLDKNVEEASVLFQDSDLLRGVLDKSSFGASTFGIVHLLYEIAGGSAVNVLLSSIARVFTLLLQMRGFTCAFADLLLTEDAEEVRRKLILGSRNTAKKVAEDWLRQNNRGDVADGTAPPDVLSEAAQDLFQKEDAVLGFEGMLIGRMKESWSKMIKECIPAGQKLPFPRNCFSAMVQTGAKGSTVNQSQISCCLGQQELEGRLVPLMATRRSLPCFAAFDLAGRTRGYIADRFLTGIRPAEFFFHCMAGREGLVDTAVKTSRSGYLQRCLIKHLECLKVTYDLSVRDSDGSVVQFLYGEDGADVTRASYLFKFEELRPNFHLLRALSEQQISKLRGDLHTADLASAPIYLEACELAKAGKLKAAAKRLGSLLAGEAQAGVPRLGEAVREAVERAQEHLLSVARAARAAGVAAPAVLLEPASSVLSPAHCLGSTSERHEGELRKYLAAAVADGRMKEDEAKAFSEYMHLKFMRCLAEPGEAVGVIAAQSMGEPSTQMTLNTFHLAGHGGANVTLGIPRLREIIQTASRSCATPLMRVKVLQDTSGDTSLEARLRFASRVQKKFRSINMLDLVARLTVHDSIRVLGGQVMWCYVCRFEFVPLDDITKKVPYLSPKRVEDFVRLTICRKLKLRLKKIITVGQAAEAAQKSKPKPDEEGGGVGKEEAEAKAGEDPEKAQKEKDGEEEAPVAEAPEEAEAKGPKNKIRRILGAEDKAEKQAQMEDTDDDDESEGGSGMYSDPEEDDKPEEQQEEEEEEQDEAEPGEQRKPKRPRAANAQEGPDEEAEEEDPVVNPGGEELEVEPAHQEPEPSKVDAATPSKPSKARGAAKATTLDDMSSAKTLLDNIAKTGDLVWNTDLKDNTMIIVVQHRYTQCPHSLFVGEMIKEICESSALQDPSSEGVAKVHIKQENDDVFLECEGINLRGLQELPLGAVDHARIYTNNIQKVLEAYGVEAARASVVKEVRGVFGHYGIEVDHRHLSLIADYMSQAGGLRPFNRKGMSHAVSPFLQMTFETTVQFLTTACQEGIADRMTSPASALIMGQVPPVGTGMVHLLVDLMPVLPKSKQTRQFTW